MNAHAFPLRPIERKPAAHKRTGHDLEWLDAALQSFVQRRIHPLFVARARRKQLVEYAGGVDKQEKSANRTLALSVLCTVAAGAGALGAPALSIVSAIGLTAIVTPLIWRVSRVVIGERKVMYRLVRLLTVPLALLTGYYFVINVMTLVFLATDKVAARTKAAHDSMRDAFRLQSPSEVWVEVEGVQIKTAFDRLRAGNVIAVEAQETIPVDGAVVGDAAMVDQHIMTGEAQPVERVPGDAALANTLVIRGRRRILVEKTGNETAAAQIADILVNASESRLKAADMSERDSAHDRGQHCGASDGRIERGHCDLQWRFRDDGAYVWPAMHAVLPQYHIAERDSDQGWPFAGSSSQCYGHRLRQDRRAHRRRAARRLCPCSPPLRRTGRVRFTAIAEYRHTHPIARAVLAAAEEEGIEIEAPDAAAYVMGMGVTVEIDERIIRVGSARLMAKNGVDIAAHQSYWRAASDLVGGSLIYVAVNKTCAGALQLEAQLCSKTEELPAKLHRRGLLKAYILSGDNCAPTEHLARMLGVTDSFAEVLPEGKKDIVRALQEKGETVYFVGDGLNDALALR